MRSALAPQVTFAAAASTNRWRGQLEAAAAAAAPALPRPPAAAPTDGHSSARAPLQLVGPLMMGASILQLLTSAADRERAAEEEPKRRDSASAMAAKRRRAQSIASAPETAVAAANGAAATRDRRLWHSAVLKHGFSFSATRLTVHSLPGHKDSAAGEGGAVPMLAPAGTAQRSAAQPQPQRANVPPPGLAGGPTAGQPVLPVSRPARLCLQQMPSRAPRCRRWTPPSSPPLPLRCCRQASRADVAQP